MNYGDGEELEIIEGCGSFFQIDFFEIRIRFKGRKDNLYRADPMDFLLKIL